MLLPARKIRKYMAAAAAAIKNRLAYRSAILGSMLTYGLFIFVFSRIWAAAYSGRADIAGYGFSDMVWYFAIAELVTFGFGRMWNRLSEDIKGGQIAYLVARPYSFVLYGYADRLGPAWFDTIIFALEGAAIAFLSTGVFPITSVPQALALFASLILSSSLMYFLQMTIALTAFWVEENSAFFWIYQKLALVVGTFMPIEFLPEPMAGIARWTPFPYLAYAPSRIAVAFSPSEALSILGIQLAWVVFAALACFGLFAIAERRLSVQGG